MKPVINIDELEMRETGNGAGFAAKVASFGPQIGSTGIGVGSPGAGSGAVPPQLVREKPAIGVRSRRASVCGP